MAVFIELVTEPLEKRFEEYMKSHRGRDDKNRTTHAGRYIARRPMRGIEIKEDTVATIRVVTACGKDIELFDSSTYQGLSKTGYSNFLLQSVQEARMEKHQIIETFGEAFVFFFGESPRFMDCQAILLNTHDFNWRAEWWANYDAYFRGTRLAELGARIYLFYDDIIVEGYLMSCSASEQAGQPNQVNIQFRIFVTNYSNISFVEPPENAYFPVRGSATLPANVDPYNTVIGAGGTTGQGYGSTRTISGGVRQYMEDNGITGDAATALEKTIRDLYLRRVGVDTDLAAGGADDPYVGLITDIAYREGGMMREKIAANVDEFTGLTGQGEYAYHQNIESAAKSILRRKLDVDDLQQRAVYACSCYGADIDDPDVINALGLGPGFGTAKKQASFSAYASAVASRGRSGGTAITTSVGNGFGGKQDPLNSVYGRPDGDSKDLATAYKFQEGQGDPTYGYRSPYGDGPGYGGSGFGDAGGTGHGSGAGSTGDPGFKDPSLFTSTGVAAAQSAYDRFMSARQDSTALTKGGPSVSMGTSGGASITVGGNPTAFALVSVQGTLDSSGQARGEPGFSALPSLGIMCPGSLGPSYSLP